MEKKENNLASWNAINKGTLMEHLDIIYTKVEEGTVIGRMPVNETTMQPDRILHGGANLALAETVAGLGSAVLVDLKTHLIRGAQVSANHVGTATEGYVFALAKIVHKGKNTHVWNIDVSDENNKLVSTCRITNIIIKK